MKWLISSNDGAIQLSLHDVLTYTWNTRYSSWRDIIRRLRDVLIIRFPRRKNSMYSLQSTSEDWFIFPSSWCWPQRRRTFPKHTTLFSRHQFVRGAPQAGFTTSRGNAHPRKVRNMCPSVSMNDPQWEVFSCSVFKFVIFSWRLCFQL